MKLRNVFAMITAAAMTLSLAACSGQSTASSTSSASSDSSSSAASESSVSSEKSTASEKSSGASYTIGICNYVDDASLNQIVENINARLAEIESEQGITIEVKYDNCNADANVMNQIIANFAADNVDLMVGVATPVAMAMPVRNRRQQNAGRVRRRVRPGRRRVLSLPLKSRAAT